MLDLGSANERIPIRTFSRFFNILLRPEVNFTMLYCNAWDVSVTKWGKGLGVQPLEFTPPRR